MFLMLIKVIKDFDMEDAHIVIWDGFILIPFMIGVLVGSFIEFMSNSKKKKGVN